MTNSELQELTLELKSIIRQGLVNNWKGIDMSIESAQRIHGIAAKYPQYREEAKAISEIIQILFDYKNVLDKLIFQVS